MKTGTFDLTQELARVAASKAAALTSSTASERSEAVTAARAAIEALREQDRAQRQREQQAAIEALAAAKSELEARAERARRERAAALMRDAFNDRADSLLSLVRKWRVEPTRALTNELRAAWAKLAARCQLELGDELSEHVLTAAFAGLIASEIPNGVANLAQGDNAVAEACGAWVRSQDPGSGQQALQGLETALTTNALRGAAEPSERDRELLALHRLHATRRDLMQAHAEHAARWKAIDDTERARNWKGPPPGSYCGPTNEFSLPLAAPGVPAVVADAPPAPGIIGRLFGRGDDAA